MLTGPGRHGMVCPRVSNGEDDFQIRRSVADTGTVPDMRIFWKVAQGLKFGWVYQRDLCDGNGREVVILVGVQKIWWAKCGKTGRRIYTHFCGNGFENLHWGKGFFIHSAIVQSVGWSVGSFGIWGQKLDPKISKLWNGRFLTPMLVIES